MNGKFVLGTALAFAASLYLSATQGATASGDHATPKEKPAAGGSMMGSEMMGSEGMGSMLMMPMMDPARGRKLFASKGCVVCHAVNGVGGEDAPALDATTMERAMNPFEFAAKMWRGAEAMIDLQREELGEPIELSGSELADIIAFTHHLEEQRKFSEADVPPRMRELIEHGHGGDGDEHGEND
jgi:cytochrome c